MQCVTARKEDHQRQHARDPERGSAWLYANPRHHGLTVPEAQEFVRDKACEVCGTEDDLCVDHCHTSGEIRGVLCRKCNSALAFLKDDPAVIRRAADYIERYREMSGDAGVT